MGSCSEIELAYIAGFLDGDGSLMIQIKKRSDNGAPRFMLTLCLYQDTRHEKPLLWIRRKFGIGYLCRRNDHITEIRVNGYKQIERILLLLLPFIKFKRIQAKAIVRASKILQKKKLSEQDKRVLVEFILIVQEENYVTKKKRTREEFLKILELTP